MAHDELMLLLEILEAQGTQGEVIKRYVSSSAPSFLSTRELHADDPLIALMSQPIIAVTGSVRLTGAAPPLPRSHLVGEIRPSSALAPLIPRKRPCSSRGALSGFGRACNAVTQMCCTHSACFQTKCWTAFPLTSPIACFAEGAEKR